MLEEKSVSRTNLQCSLGKKAACLGIGEDKIEPKLSNAVKKEQGLRIEVQAAVGIVRLGEIIGLPLFGRGHRIGEN